MSELACTNKRQFLDSVHDLCKFKTAECRQPFPTESARVESQNPVNKQHFCNEQPSRQLLL